MAYAWEQKHFWDFMEGQYKESYFKNAWNVQTGLERAWDIAGLDTARINKVLSRPWGADGKNFSSRIWEKKEKLVKDLGDAISRGIISGDSYKEMSKALASKMTGKYRMSDVDRLITTESAYFASEAQKDCFNDLEVQQYEIVATLDDLTSKVCQRLDGKVFDMKDYNPGQTAPPFHPHCRSCTCPYFDDEFTEGEMRVARDSETGKTYRVPSNMTYSEWEKSFVKGGSKSGYTSMDLQLFAKNDKKDIKRKIRNGELDGDLFYSQKKKFDKIFENGIETPLGKVYNKGDNFYHIANGHDEMVNPKAIERVKQTLIKPSEILETKDKNNKKVITYLEQAAEPIIVVTRGDIITAYMPDTGYLKKIMKKGRVLYVKNN